MNPRYMNSKFQSRCCDCDSVINAGERIRYLGRSKAQCSACMPPEVNAPQNANTGVSAANSGDAWADALAWDDATPEPGESIGGQPIGKLDPGSNVIAYERPGKVETVEVPPTAAAIEYAEQVIADNAKKPEPDQAIEQFEFSDGERAEALTSELLIILVNAIDVAGITGRHTLATYCREQAKRSLDMSSRQHIWHGIAQAISRA